MTNSLPQTIHLESGREYRLESEEDIELNEDQIEGSGLNIRTVRVKDLRLGADRYTTFTEVSYSLGSDSEKLIYGI
jgi:hypothetical protein